MHRSKCEVYIHYVWSTLGRAPVITAEMEAAIHQRIGEEAWGLGGAVLAVNGMADHVHLAVRMRATLAPATLMKRVKGSSSRFANQAHPASPQFAWQEGYGAFSVSPEDLERVVAYVENQKQHHASGTEQPAWEDCGAVE